jgi:hypothetical protein
MDDHEPFTDDHEPFTDDHERLTDDHDRPDRRRRLTTPMTGSRPRAFVPRARISRNASQQEMQRRLVVVQSFRSRVTRHALDRAAHEHCHSAHRTLSLCTPQATSLDSPSRVIAARRCKMTTRGADRASLGRRSDAVRRPRSRRCERQPRVFTPRSMKIRLSRRTA